ncbi:MAG: hypothetical protein PHQ36_07420 [Anaerolineales bacterium]|nr:hypothetical protein [Anaerolineales bacterium]
MNASLENIQLVFVCLIIGVYAIWRGVLAIYGINSKIPIIYNLGMHISNLILGRHKTAKIEEEMNDSNKSRRYGIFFLMIGVFFIIGGIFLLFA